MSVLVAAVQTVAPVAPVVKEVVTNNITQPVAQTPAVVMQLAALVSTYGAGLVVSLFHIIGKLKIKWLDGNVNRVLALILGVGIGLTSAYVQGGLSLNVHGLVVAVISTAMALFGQGTTFNVFQFLGELNSTTKTVSNSVSQELAADAAPAPQAQF